MRKGSAHTLQEVVRGPMLSARAEGVGAGSVSPSDIPGTHESVRVFVSALFVTPGSVEPTLSVGY